MIADWKNAREVLPEERIRVITCDKFGYVQICYYGMGFVGASGWRTKCWRSENDTDPEQEVIGEILWWDYFPKPPDHDKKIENIFYSLGEKAPEFD